MNQKHDDPRRRVKIGDRATSDVIIRLTTDEGRDDQFHCHIHILTQKSQFFASRLLEEFLARPTSDSRRCVEVHCPEPEVNAHVSILRLLYAPELDTCHGVKNTLGILHAADRLGCHEIARACAAYLEAAPWDEAEEDEILRSISVLGSRYRKIVSRLLPVDPELIFNLFVSAVACATSPHPGELRRSAQEQVEYMLTEDDDAPLMSPDDELVKASVKESAGNLLTQLDSVLAGSLQAVEPPALPSLLSDVSWVCQILSKMEMMGEVVCYWVGQSAAIAAAVEALPDGIGQLEARVKVAEVVLKVLEAIGCGSVILPPAGRLGVVNAWLPFVQQTRPMVDAGGSDGEDGSAVKVDGELWESLESAFVSTVLTLPSADLAGILSRWLRAEQVQYPDLTEAFEVWCYRLKAARRRFGLDDSPR